MPLRRSPDGAGTRLGKRGIALMLWSLRRTTLLRSCIAHENRASSHTMWMGLVLALAFCSCMAATSWGQAKASEKAKAAGPKRSVSSQPQGLWASPVYFCSATPCVVGANAIVLNTGSVLFYYYPASPGKGSQAVLLNPVTGAVTFVSLTISEDIFCSGVTVL